MMKEFQPPIRARVFKEWQAMYPDPIDVRAGESIILGKTDPDWPGWQWCTDPRSKSGWVPITFIEKSDESTGTILFDFTARELSILPGDELELLCLESGWYWARNARNDEGWIPGTHIEA
jgi:SH3 domain